MSTPFADGSHDSRKNAIAFKGETFKEPIWEQLQAPVCPEAEQRTLSNAMKLVVERLVDGEVSKDSLIFLDSGDVEGMKPGKQLKLLKKAFGTSTALCLDPSEYAGLLVSFDTDGKAVLERPLLPRVLNFSFDQFAQRMTEKFPNKDISQLLDGFKVLVDTKKDNFAELMSDIVRIAGFPISADARESMKVNMDNYNTMLRCAQKLRGLGVDVSFFDEIRDTVIIDPDFVTTLQSYVDGVESGEMNPKQISFDFVP